MYAMIQEGVLPPLTDITAINYADLGAKNPIIFIKVCDKVNKLFIQSQNEELRVFQTDLLLLQQSNVQKNIPDSSILALEKNKNQGKVRQLSTMTKCLANGSMQQYAAVVLQSSDDKYELQLVDLNTLKTVAKKDNVTTAVFNQAEDAIIAGLDTMENGLAILGIPALDE